MNNDKNTVLSKIGRLIETITDLSSTTEIYDCIVKFVPDVLPADHVTISQYNSEDGTISILALYDNVEPRLNLSLGQRLPSYSTYQAYAQNVANPIIYEPGSNLNRELNRMLNSAGIISVLVVPLISGLEIIGTINIASKSHRYQQKDKFRLEKISALLATSITHTVAYRSHGQIARQRLYAKHLQHLNILSEKLLAADSIDDALQLVANCATQLVNARRVSFCEQHDDHDTVRIVGLVGGNADRSGTLVKLADSGLEDSLIHGQKKYTSDLLNSPVQAHQSLGASGDIHLWSFPIFCHDQPRRCLNITSQGMELHEDDAMSVLDTLARLANSTIERIAAQMETILQAKTDPLTGLCNRKEFNEQLDAALARIKSDGDTGIMYLDLDLFKNVNDTMGHLVGDQVLVEIATRIRQIVAPRDTIARIGGDEFMILLTELFNRPSIENIAKSLIGAISTPIEIADQEIVLGASVGVCVYPEHGDTAGTLIKNADIAMYKAKETGRNRYLVFSAVLAEEFSRRLQLQQDLLTALKEDQLSLVFQPQYDIHTMQVCGVEVLIRWQHPTLGWISPDVFVPIAENCGLINSVTDWVLKNALLTLAEWHKIRPDLRIAVNVSAVEFSPQFDLIERLKKTISRSGVNPTALEIELTETAFLKHPKHAAKLAVQLTEAGISIALDDFGTGYASLSYLVQLPISCLKIDKSFVDGVEFDNKKQAVINGILAICKGLDMTCLGEGVETIEQLQWLKNAGCHSAQGYLISKPVEREKIAALLEAPGQDAFLNFINSKQNVA